MDENDLSFITTYVEQYWPEFQITQQQLEHPTFDFVVQFYEHCRDLLEIWLHYIVDNKNTETGVQINTDGESIFPLLRFTNKYFKKLSDQADCTLTLTDLYVPTAKRTKIRFKLLLHLLLFYEDNVEKLKSAAGERLKQAEGCGTRKVEKEQCKADLAKAAENLATSEDALLKLQKEFKKSEIRYAHLQEKNEDTERHNKKLQHDLKLLVDTHQNKDTLLTNIKANIERLNEEVVTEDSYKSLQDLLENLEQKCEKLEAEVSCNAMNLESKKPAVEHFCNISKLIQNLNCKELETLQTAISEEEERLKFLDSNHKEKAKKLQKLCESSFKYKEAMKTTTEAIQSEALKDNTVFEQIERDLKQISLEEVDEESYQVKINSKKSVLLEKISCLEDESQNRNRDIEKLNLFCANTYTEILSDENIVTNDFNEVLRNITKNMIQPAFTENQRAPEK